MSKTPGSITQVLLFHSANRYSWMVKESESVSLSVVSNSATPWTVASQASLSLWFPGQEYWSGLPFPSPEDLPDPETEPWSPALKEDSLLYEPPGKPRFTWCAVCLVTQLCPNLCDPMGCNPPDASVQWIIQVRILERVAVSFCRGSYWCMARIPISCFSFIGRWVLYH